MTNEQKELLLKDLSSRLPYGVKGRVFAETTNGEFDLTGDMIFNDEPFDVVLDEINVGNGEIRVTAIKDDETRDFIDSIQDWGDPYTIETFKPYLRPMSSMTEEEKSKLRQWGCLCMKPNDIVEDIDSYIVEDIGVYGAIHSIPVIDWLNANHFDYRGLIEKGLALEAPERMYEF